MLALIKKHMAGYRLIAALGLVLKLLEATIELFVPILIALIIDTGLYSGDFSYILRIGVIMLALYITGYILAILCQFFASKAAFGFSFNLRNSLFAHITSPCFAASSSFSPAALISRLNTDINNAQNAVNRFIRLGSRAPFLLVGALIMALILHPIMALIIFIAASFISIAIFFIMKRAAKTLRKINTGLDETARLSGDIFSYAISNDSAAKKHHAQQEFSYQVKKLEKNSIRFFLISLFSSPLSYLAVNIVIAMILYFGGAFVYGGSLSQGEVVALINYMLQILNALIIMIMLAIVFNRAIMSAKRINEVYDSCGDASHAVREIILHEQLKKEGDK